MPRSPEHHEPSEPYVPAAEVSDRPIPETRPPTPESKGVIDALSRFVRRKYMKYVAGAVLSLEISMAASDTYQDLTSTAEIEIENLEQLDPGAKPERIRRIIDETIPRGWANEVEGIEYSGRPDFPMLAYGMPHARGMASAGGGDERRRTDITFYRPEKDGVVNSDELWGQTLLHEVGHAVDWQNHPLLSEDERRWLQTEIKKRIKSKNRYISGYVEAINPPIPGTRDNMRAGEYWAEIVEAYLAGDNHRPDMPPLDPLPAEDRQLVEFVIRKTDPQFNREAAARRREEILSEIRHDSLINRVERAIGRLDLPATEKGSLLTFLRHNFDVTAENINPDVQESGRVALMELIKSFATTTERLRFVLRALHKHALREVLLRDLQRGTIFEPEYRQHAKYAQELRRGAREFGTEGAAFLRDLDYLVLEREVAIGSERAAVKKMSELWTLDERFGRNLFLAVQEEARWGQTYYGGAQPYAYR